MIPTAISESLTNTVPSVLISLSPANLALSIVKVEVSVTTISSANVIVGSPASVPPPVILKSEFSILLSIPEPVLKPSNVSLTVIAYSTLLASPSSVL